MTRTRLSSDFYLDEFSCHDGTEVPQHYRAGVSQLALGVLQPLRDAWGSPLIVVSGYRTFAWNRAVGGALASTHLTAEGADVRPVFLRDLPRLVALALALHAQGNLAALGGLGEYPGWVHLDCRVPADGHLRRWQGTGMGSEP